MSQTGYTPIQLYRTSTASATPTTGNLSAGELAINLLDEKLYFKNSSGTVKLLAANVMPVANGGTALTATPTNGQIPIGNGTGYTLATLSAGSGISISNTSGGITISNSGASGTVTSVGGTGSINGLTLTGAVTSSGNLTLGGTFRFNQSTISTNTAAAVNTVYVITATLTLTLPGSPTAGDIVGVVNMSGATTVTVLRNGTNIMALAENLTVDINNTGFILMYANATQGWVLLP